MRGSATCFFAAIAFLVGPVSLPVTSAHAEITAESNNRHPGSIWPGTLRCQTDRNLPLEFIPLMIYCQDDIGFGPEQDLIDKVFLKEVEACCSRYGGQYITIDCTVYNSRNPSETNVTKFPC